MANTVANRDRGQPSDGVSKKGGKRKTRRCTFGRKPGLAGKKGRRIYVSVPASRTRRAIETEKNGLGNQPMPAVKRYLKKRGLLRAGSSAPVDLTRAMFQGAVLAGELANTAPGALLHDYLTDDRQVSTTTEEKPLALAPSFQ